MGILKPNKVPLSALSESDFDDLLSPQAKGLDAKDIPACILEDGPIDSNAGTERSEQRPASVARTSSITSIQINDLKAYGKKAKAAHKRSQKAAKAAVEAVLDMGEQLMKARELMTTTKQRGFGKWVEGLGISRMHANKSIRVYERLGHCVTVDNLGLQSCYQLASGGVPGQAVDEVLMLTDEGPVDAQAVAEVINKHREPKTTVQQPAPIILETTSGTTAIKLRAPGDDPIRVLQEAIDAYKAGQSAAA